MRIVKYLAVGVAVLLVLLLARQLALQKVRASFSYGVRAEFREVPPEDKELEQWLASQPGVVRVGVGRDGKVIQVVWIMVQNLRGSPSAPDIRSEFERLGYRGLVDYNGDWVDR